MIKIAVLAVWELKRILRGSLFWLSVIGLLAGLGSASAGAREGMRLIFTPSFGSALPRIWETMTVRRKPTGFVDAAHFLQVPPDPSALRSLRQFETKEAADAALKAGAIEGYFEIEARFPTEGEITHTPEDWYPEDTASFERIVRLNLLKGDRVLDSTVNSVLNLPFVKLDDSGSPQSVFRLLTEYIQASLTFSWVFICIVAYTFILGWIEEAFNGEKDSLTLELVLTSARPMEVVVAKFAGMYASGFLQAMIVAGAFRVLNPNLTAFQGPLLSFLWNRYSFSLFLCAFYLFLTNVMFLGLKLRTVSAHTREEKSGALLFFAAVTACLLFPVGSICSLYPESFLAWSLSLFPLTAPVAMIVRMIHSAVPVEELVLSLGILMFTAAASMRSWRRSLAAAFDPA